jgi:hypothetical protein
MIVFLRGTARNRILSGAVLLSSILALSGLAGCGEKAGDAKEAAKKAGADTAASSQASQQFTAAEPVTDSTTAYSLQIRPKVGDVYAYRITQRSSQEMQQLKASDETAYNFTCKITGVNTDGSVTMEMRYDSIRVRHTGPRSPNDSTVTTLTFDSRKKGDSAVPGSEQFRVLIGQRVNITLSKTGQVREVSNIEPILSAILGKKRDSVPPERLESVRQLIKVQAYSSVIQQMFLQSLPDSGVAIGRTWNRKDSVPIGGIPSHSTVTYKLVEVRKVEDRPVGQIQMLLTVDFPKKTIDNQFMTATINNASVGGNGEALVDLESGLPLHKSTVIDTRLNLTGKVKAGPEAGKSQTTSQHEATSMLVERIGFVPARGSE